MGQISVFVKEELRGPVMAALASAAAGVRVASYDKGPDAEELSRSQLVVAEAAFASRVSAAVAESGAKPRVLLLWEQPDPAILDDALACSAVIGLLGTNDGNPEPWELMYAARRVLVPSEPAPLGSQLLPWGSTTVEWQPRTTAELHHAVSQAENIGRNLGVSRREATLVSAAAHELLMNAMYDAPVDARGHPRFAHDRKAPVSLPEGDAPMLRFSISATLLALDVADRFGRLPRQRFLQGIRRGLQGQADGSPALDTSHGGAGLGIHTLFSSGSVLRAELKPLQSTLVTWMLRRTRPGDRRSEARSVFFLPLT